MTEVGAKHGGSLDVNEPPSGVTSVTGPYRPGEVLDQKYILIRKIGEGGMGAVWVAHNTVLDVHCALKIIEIGASRAVAERLLDEARAAAKLGHPSIVRVLDYGESARGDPFIAMELLDGEDLAQVLERQARLDPIFSVQMLLPIAHALGTAHSKGIVHRDVKPENIFLAKDEVASTQPKLLDFGIVRVVSNPRRLTIDGAVLGTPDYMSPEQARGQTTTGQTDLWSFCVVLYEIIAGRRPFDGDNYNSLMRAIIEDDPIPLVELDVVDSELSAIVQRGLCKDPEQRWQSMRELGEELALWLEACGAHEDITGTSLRRSWLADSESKRIALPDYVQRSLEAAPHSELAASRRADTQAASGSVPRVRMPQSQPGHVAIPSAGPVAPGPVAVQQFPEFEPSSMSESNLAAIARLHSEGDPELMLRRSTQRRNIMLFLAVIVVVVGAVLAVLIGTGIVMPAMR